MKKRERFNRDIEVREVARLNGLFPELDAKDIQEIFHSGFGFGLCEGISAAKRMIQKAIDTKREG